MGDAMVEFIETCVSFTRVKVGFRESHKELQPLPTRGIGYKWGLPPWSKLRLAKNE